MKNSHYVVYYNILGVSNIGGVGGYGGGVNKKDSPLWFIIISWEYLVLGGLGGFYARGRGLQANKLQIARGLGLP